VLYGLLVLLQKSDGKFSLDIPGKKALNLRLGQLFTNLRICSNFKLSWNVNKLN